jgi:DNA-binding MarR family transcriptional regulator
MSEPSSHSAARLLLLLAEFGSTVSNAMKAAVGEAELVGNTPILIMCHIDLHGPQRPVNLEKLTGLTSGGLSHMLDRMEGLGVVERGRQAVRGDRRGVLVSLTVDGTALLKAMTAELERRVPETRALVEEIVRVLEG